MKYYLYSMDLGLLVSQNEAISFEKKSLALEYAVNDEYRNGWLHGAVSPDDLFIRVGEKFKVLDEDGNDRGTYKMVAIKKNDGEDDYWVRGARTDKKGTTSLKMSQIFREEIDFLNKQKKAGT